MSLEIGRQSWIGFAREITAGVPVTPASYVQFLEFTLQAKHEPLPDVQSYGLRDEEFGQSVAGKKWSEGEIKAILDPTNIGFILAMALDVPTSVNSAGSVYTHTFVREATTLPITYSITHKRINDQLLYTFVTVDSLKLAFENGLISAQAKMMGRFPVATTSGTQTVVSGTLLSFKDSVIRISSTITAAESATPIKVQSFEISFENNAQINHRSGNNDANDISFGKFKVTGSMTIFFENTTQRDYFYNLTKNALIFQATGNQIGSGLSEYVKIRVPKFRVQDYEISGSADEPIVETMKFVAEYDTATSLTVDVAIRNLKTSY